MIEEKAQEIMEQTIVCGTPWINTLEYMEALALSIDILGVNYTREELKNWILVGKYPFLAWINEENNKIDYTTTWFDNIPIGWRKAFGEMLCEEIKQQLIKDGELDKYQIFDIKEKFGQLRWYDNGNQAVYRIIDKYSVLSENICIRCGKPDVPMINNGGWWSPYCKQCFCTPSDWYKKEYPNDIDNWIEQHKENWNMANTTNNTMVDSYTVRTYSPDKKAKDTVYIISDTASKIRKKYYE